MHDAVTGDEVARVSSDGVDMRAALDYGRHVGGPALRELTFHERAALVKAVGRVLREHRDELYELSARTGSTLYDAKFDVDGGIGVLLAYASKAKRELPNDTFYVEGAAEPLGRAGQFLGQHILTSAAAAWPCRSTRSTSRSGDRWKSWRRPHRRRAVAGQAGLADRLSHRAAVELIVESGLLPEGALQLVSGGAGDLLDHLEEHDLLSFTGSASTAQRLRSHPNVVAARCASTPRPIR